MPIHLEKTFYDKAQKKPITWVHYLLSLYIEQKPKCFQLKK